jgi:hypothetical protein
MPKDSTQISLPGLIHELRPYLAETGFSSSTLTRKLNFLLRHDFETGKRSLNGVKAIISAKSQDSLLDNYRH